MTLNENIKKRFEEKFIPEPNSGCWLWYGHTLACGYGQFRVDTKLEVAHRVSYALYKSSIPKSLQVLHKCDIRSCVNPDHLFLGTQKDNMNDMFEKGRDKLRGERHFNAKLNAEIIKEIRAIKTPDKDTHSIYGISPSHFRAIRNRRTWRHIL